MPIPRSLEPEAVFSAADAAEYAGIDHSGSDSDFCDGLAGLARFKRGRVVELGAGAGTLATEVCRRFKGASVTGVESSAHMLRLALKGVSAAGLAGKVRLLRADALGTGLRAGAFDLVISTNLVHHIADPEKLFSEAARLCRRGGGLLMRDLRRPRTRLQLDSLMRLAASDTPRQRQLLHDSYLAALRPEEVLECARRAGLAGVRVGPYGRRHWQLYRPVSAR
jgi:ubiquinone/menaquinone biosynthesis C-methylase UbiE